MGAGFGALAGDLAVVRVPAGDDAIGSASSRDPARLQPRM